MYKLMGRWEQEPRKNTFYIVNPTITIHYLYCIQFHDRNLVLHQLRDCDNFQLHISYLLHVHTHHTISTQVYVFVTMNVICEVFNF